MAEVALDGTDLILTLTSAEKIEAVHGDVRVPISAVTGVEVLEDALSVVHGFRIGTGIPGVLVVGTILHPGGTAFVVVHHGHPRGVRINLTGSEYDQLIVGSEDPEAVAARISGAR